MIENPRGMNNPDPIQPTSWSDWKYEGGGEMIRRGIGSSGQQMQEIFEPDYPALTTIETFIDAKKIIEKPWDPMAQIPKGLIDSSLVLFAQSCHTLVIEPDVFSEDDRRALVLLADLEAFNTIYEKRTLWPRDKDSYVHLHYSDDSPCTCTLNTEAPLDSTGLGNIDLSFYVEGVVVQTQKLIGSSSERDELYYLTLLNTRNYLMGLEVITEEEARIIREIREIEETIKRTYEGLELFKPELRPPHRIFAHYGDEIRVDDDILTIKREGDVVTVIYKKNNDSQPGWEANFPVRIPLQEILEIINDPQADFRVIKQLLPVSFRKTQGI